MKLSAHSKNRILETFDQYEVPKEYADPIFNYLVYGMHPGGFWNSVFANDFMGAMARSHPLNTIVALKNTVSWMMNHLTAGTTHGSYPVVEQWLQKTAEKRREVLEALGLVYTEHSEIIMILEDRPTHEPILFAGLATDYDYRIRQNLTNNQPYYIMAT